MRLVFAYILLSKLTIPDQNARFTKPGTGIKNMNLYFRLGFKRITVNTLPTFIKNYTTSTHAGGSAT
jgi:hypothetical protein